MRRLGWRGAAGVALVLLMGACEAQEPQPEPTTFGTIEGALTGSTFESTDGDLAATVLDWQNAPNFSAGTDELTGNGDDSLGQGSKDDIENPTLVSDQIPPNKSDIMRFYVASQTVGGNTYLYLAWIRSNVLGSANFSFEFNKSESLTGNGVTPVRSPGDLLITFDWAEGNNAVVLGYSLWLTAQAPGQTGNPKKDCEQNPTFPCWGKRKLFNATVADGAVNFDGAVPDYTQSGNPSLPAKTFGEAAINMTAAGLTGCFSTSYLKSRSSDAFNAELKDFAPPIPANLCIPATIRLKKVDDAGTPVGGAVLQLWQDGGTGGGGTANALDAGCLTSATNDTCTDTLVAKDSGGTSCTTEVDATDDSTDGDIDGVGNCVYTLADNGTYIGHEVSVPSGYGCCAADVVQVVTIGTASQSFTLTFANPRQFRAILVVCEEAGDTLYASNVEMTIGGSPVAKVTARTDSAAATLCTRTVTSSTDGAHYTPLVTGTYQCRVTIGSTPVAP